MSLTEWLEIIRRVQNGEWKAVAEAFGIARITLYSILQQREKLFQLNSDLDDRNSKRNIRWISNVDDWALTEILYTWYYQCRAAGIPVFGKCLQDNSLSIRQNLIRHSDVKASNCWPNAFKRKLEICQLSVQGVKISAEEGNGCKRSFVSFSSPRGSIGTTFITRIILKVTAIRNFCFFGRRGMPHDINHPKMGFQSCAANASGKHKISWLMFG